MYLWNIFVIQAVFIFHVDDVLKKMGDNYGYFTYGIVILTGCLLSVVYGKLSGIVVQNIRRQAPKTTDKEN